MGSAVLMGGIAEQGWVCAHIQSPIDGVFRSLKCSSAREVQMRLPWDGQPLGTRPQMRGRKQTSSPKGVARMGRRSSRLTGRTTLSALIASSGIMGRMRFRGWSGFGDCDCGDYDTSEAGN